MLSQHWSQSGRNIRSTGDDRCIARAGDRDGYGFGIAQRQTIVVIRCADGVGQNEGFAGARKLKASLPELKFQVSVLGSLLPLRIAVGVTDRKLRSDGVG